jgi:hypothetical protein
MAYAIFRVPATSGGLDAEPTLNRRWSRRRRALCPAFGPLHDAVWTPGRWRRSGMAGWRSLRGCLIARRLGGDKQEVEMHSYTTAFRLFVRGQILYLPKRIQTLKDWFQRRADITTKRPQITMQARQSITNIFPVDLVKRHDDNSAINNCACHRFMLCVLLMVLHNRKSDHPAR